jgi:uncharacterized protein (DUF433 family)
MASTSVQYQYLAPNPKSSYRSLFIKGTRIRARVLYGLHMNEEEPWSVEFIAEQYGLPVQAVEEAIAYCRSDPIEIRQDQRLDDLTMEAMGMNEPGYKSHGKPKPVTPQQLAEIRRRSLEVGHNGQ